ncbi:MAG: hypothetical protein MJ146_03675 [Clostridia bacterium]|nr:hypothetical protein [Clostridia bacterium]
MEESKRERFIRLAEARTNKIIDMIQLLGNCSNTSIYDYSSKDIDKIFGAIEAELKKSKQKFQQQDNKKGNKFTLD